VVFDDGALSLIAAKQEQRGLDAVPLSYAGPDLLALGRSFGFDAHLARDERGVAQALEAALASQAPTLVVARVDPSGYRRTLDLVRGAPARGAEGPTV
jgi:acetolactate synthase-1/2/3 large subunit